MVLIRISSNQIFLQLSTQQTDKITSKPGPLPLQGLERAIKEKTEGPPLWGSTPHDTRPLWTLAKYYFYVQISPDRSHQEYTAPLCARSATKLHLKVESCLLSWLRSRTKHRTNELHISADPLLGSGQGLYYLLDFRSIEPC